MRIKQSATEPTGSREISQAVKDLSVDKTEFDAAMKKLIATPPIRSHAKTVPSPRSARARHSQ
jgi:hypothetical protein